MGIISREVLKDLGAQRAPKVVSDGDGVGIGQLQTSMFEMGEQILDHGQLLRDVIQGTMNSINVPAHTLPQSGVRVGSIGASDFNFNFENLNLSNPSTFNISGGSSSPQSTRNIPIDYKQLLGLVVITAALFLLIKRYGR